MLPSVLFKAGMATFGGIAFVKGIVGFGVAIKHDMKILFGYDIAVAVAIFGEVIAMITAYVVRSLQSKDLEKLLTRTLEESYNGAVMNGDRIMEGGDDTIDTAWDFVMARSR